MTPGAGPLGSVTFDGSHLGSYPLTQVLTRVRALPNQLTNPRTPIMAAELQGTGISVLVRRTPIAHDQVLVDGLKPLFDLQATGLHPIRLQGIPDRAKGVNGSDWTRFQLRPTWSEYLLMPAPMAAHRVQPPLDLLEAGWLDWHLANPDGFMQRRVLRQIQRILVFWDLLGIQTRRLESILVTATGLLTIDEMHIDLTGPRQARASDNRTLEQLIFPEPELRIELVAKLPLDLRSQMLAVVSRLDPNKIWWVDVIERRVQERRILWEQHYQS